jgi:CRP-like cAMP-binding protein
MSGLANLFLAMHRTLSAPMALGPTELLIYVTIAVANVQRLMRERCIPPGCSGTDILPREWVVPISRNAIASATGLPRETVRRQVAGMIASGLLIEDERGGVTTAIGMIQDQGLEPLLEAVLAEFTRTAEALLRTGVIAVRTN